MHPTSPPVRRHSSPAGTSRPWWDAVLAVLGLVLPVTCVCCGAPDRACCASCRAGIDARPRRRRLVAGVRLDAAFAYEGPVRVLVLELKLRGRVDLAPVLAPRFGTLVAAALADAPGALLVRVPPSRAGARRRGFDPVDLLLRRSRVRARARSLTRRRTPRPRGAVGRGAANAGTVGAHGTAGAHGQKGRSALERVEATVGTLRAHGVAGHDVVVVDDVVTTGVTMAEAVRAVRAAGGRVVRCVALAEVPE